MNGEKSAGIGEIERITADEQAYHARVVAGVRAAQEESRRTEAVADAWFAHLLARYALTEADTVMADGTIRRSRQQAAEKQAAGLEKQAAGSGEESPAACCLPPASPLLQASPLLPEE